MRVCVAFSAKKLKILQCISAAFGNWDDVMNLYANRRLQAGKLCTTAPAAPTKVPHVGRELAKYVWIGPASLARIAGLWDPPESMLRAAV